MSHGCENIADFPHLMLMVLRFFVGFHAPQPTFLFVGALIHEPEPSRKHFAPILLDQASLLDGV